MSLLVTSAAALFTIKLENNVDPDQLASKKPADPDQHHFQNGIYLDLACCMVTIKFPFIS